MAKQKKFKLNRTTGYSPVIAVLGGRHPMDEMPMLYSKNNSVSLDKPKKSKGFERILKPRGIFTKRDK